METDEDGRSRAAIHNSNIRAGKDEAAILQERFKITLKFNDEKVENLR
jgi:hypothetical protein